MTPEFHVTHHYPCDVETTLGRLHGVALVYDLTPDRVDVARSADRYFPGQLRLSIAGQ